MKKFSSLLLALIACAGTIFAEKIQIGDLYYNLNADNLTAEVTYQEYWSETNYSYLTTINIPESVEYNSVTYSVTSIGRDAFYQCSGLTSITIPNSVTSIGNYAFYNCSGLTSIVVASGNTTFDSRENCNAIIETSSNMLIQGCKNTIIPNSVTSIGQGAFSYCSGLTSITIPNSVTSIGYAAFYECSGLTSITIPNSVTSIGEWAFAYCSGLTSVTNYAATPQTINSYVFYAVDLSSCTLYVPEGSINLYKAANGWKDFSNIQAIDTEDIDQIQLNSTVKNHKILYNGKVYILTGDKTYTVTGQQLK